MKRKTSTLGIVIADCLKTNKYEIGNWLSEIHEKMGTVVGTCMPETEHHQTTTQLSTLAPIRRRRYGNVYYPIIAQIHLKWNSTFLHLWSPVCHSHAAMCDILNDVCVFAKCAKKLVFVSKSIVIELQTKKPKKLMNFNYLELGHEMTKTFPKWTKIQMTNLV